MIAAVSDDSMIASAAGIFRKIPQTATITGTRTIQCSANPRLRSSGSARALSGAAPVAAEPITPTTVYTTSATINDGPDVYTMCLMCEYKFAFAPMAAMFVESESGDILSPKYAPDTTAPAITGSGALSAAAVPMIATPSVPADPHDVPVNDDIRAEPTNAVRAMYCGFTMR